MVVSSESLLATTAYSTYARIYLLSHTLLLTRCAAPAGTVLATRYGAAAACARVRRAVYFRTGGRPRRGRWRGCIRGRRGPRLRGLRTRAPRGLRKRAVRSPKDYNEALSIYIHGYSLTVPPLPYTKVLVVYGVRGLTQTNTDVGTYRQGPYGSLATYQAAPPVENPVTPRQSRTTVYTTLQAQFGAESARRDSFKGMHCFGLPHLLGAYLSRRPRP